MSYQSIRIKTHRTEGSSLVRPGDCTVELVENNDNLFSEKKIPTLGGVQAVEWKLAVGDHAPQCTIRTLMTDTDVEVLPKDVFLKVQIRPHHHMNFWQRLKFLFNRC